MSDIESLIIDCLKEVNEIAEDKYERLVFITPETSIQNHDAGEYLDSVDFVGFLFLLEDKIAAAKGKHLKLQASGKVFMRSDHPFKTVGSLGKYIEGML